MTGKAEQQKNQDEIEQERLREQAEREGAGEDRPATEAERAAERQGRTE